MNKPLLVNKSEVPKYIPGICNIGIAEIQKRKKVTIGGAVFTILFMAAGIVFKFSPVLKLLVFIPVTGTLVCWQQVYYHFCAAFGMLGVFRFEGDINKLNSSQKDYIAKDRRKAIVIITKSILFGGGIAVIYSIFS